MKFSYNWIAELVDGLDVDAHELGRLITTKTAECEEVVAFGAHLAQVCAARVVAVEPIPDSKNKKATVETGRYGAKTVVCGAPNCREGITTAYVPAGVTLPDGTEILTAEINGLASDGMLASGAELGINSDAAGVLVFDAAPGEAIPGCAPDWIIEIDNKSITHRPDLWGHHGLAREVAAILGKKLKDPVDLSLLPDGEGDIEVASEDFGLCPRYSALTFDNVTVQPSPLWMQYRLETIGLNAISNVVDVTNYVLSEIAQPMHAFDRDTLTGNKLVARPGRPGEVVAALNEETYQVTPADCIIGDGQGAVAIGGVMGGLETRVIDSTTRIALESACFHGASIRRTSSRLKLRTDASVRFEKAQDPLNTVRGLARAIALFREVSPGIRLVGGVGDAKRDFPAPPPIALDIDWLANKLGRRVELAEMRRILESLSFGVEETSASSVSVSVPSWRATRDVSIREDLVEEVGRMIGYDSIPLQAPLTPATEPPSREERSVQLEIRRLVAAQGYTEVMNYSFVSEDILRELDIPPESQVKVINPIAADQGLLRSSLVPGIVRNIRENSRYLSQFRLFEIGYQIHRRGPAPPPGKRSDLPVEVAHLVAAVYSRKGDGVDGLFEVKRLIECLMPGAELIPAEPRSYEHPHRTFEIDWRGEPLGYIFELHPRIVEGRAALLDLDVQAFQLKGSIKKRYHPLHRYPGSEFDLSVVAGEREFSGDIERRLKDLTGDSLESIEYLRRYTGSQLPEGKQSLSYRLKVFAADHTLTSEEVGAIRDRIIEGMKQAGYDLRL